jgi:hypothetical protein
MTSCLTWFSPPAHECRERLKKMPQPILSVHSGVHDVGAVMFDDYHSLAAVQLERLTRYRALAKIRNRGRVMRGEF